MEARIKNIFVIAILKCTDCITKLKIIASIDLFQNINYLSAGTNFHVQACLEKLINRLVE